METRNPIACRRLKAILATLPSTVDVPVTVPNACAQTTKYQHPPVPAHLLHASDRERQAGARSEFPFLQESGITFMENAGGSQVPRCVADAVHNYMLRQYVQLGAQYALSQRSTEIVARAHTFINDALLNGGRVGKTALGASSSALLATLAAANKTRVKPLDELVVAHFGHESNIGPWVNLAATTGARVVWWKARTALTEPKSTPAVTKYFARVCTEDLGKLLSHRTKIVALPHVSNLLGSAIDVEAVMSVVRSLAPNAVVVLDGVAYAPHRLMDVEKWGVDWYCFSTYKVYGPHMAALFGRNEQFAALQGPNHFFVANDDIPYKFELGGVSHEGCAGILALQPYLRRLAGDTGVSKTNDVDAWMIPRPIVEKAFARGQRLESATVFLLLSFLREQERQGRVHVVGESDPLLSSRVPTIAFVPAEGRLSPSLLCRKVQAAGFAIRHGNMYSIRLTRQLGLDDAEGCVRVSLVHYNTEDEVRALCDLLDTLL